MDDLQFRRTVYADPHTTDENVKQAAAEDASKQAFWDELKQMEAEMQQAAKVDVPDGLAQRLILRQSIQSHQVNKRRVRWHLALAASVAFVFGVSFTLWQQQQGFDLSEHAIAHVLHEADGFALKVDNDVEYSTVNAKLASIGTSISENIGRIYFANFCNFDNLRSFHMVMEGEQGKVTVFVVPHDEDHRVVDSFTGEGLYGEVMDFKKARVILVTEEGKSFSKLKSKLKENVLFSA